MKAFSCLLPSLVFALFVTGCSREREISGQIFVVTQGRENVKMGLVGVHVVSEVQLKTIGTEILRDYKQARQEHEQSQAQARADLAAVQQFESDLNLLVPSGLTVPEADEFRAEIESRRKTLKSDGEDPFQSSLLGKALAVRLFEKLPSTAAKTDADGRFTIKAKGKVWLLARSARTVGKNEETYFWAAAADPATTQNQNAILLSNDSLIEELDSLLSFLANVSGESLTPLSVPTIQTNPALTQWASGVLEKIKPAVATAKARAEAEAKTRAMADELERQRRMAEAKLVTERAASEAKAVAEKWLAWVGAGMRRANFNEDKVKKVLVQGGTVVVWGDNKFAQCNAPAGLNGIVTVAAGAYHTVALKQSGTVVAWGENSEGQCSVPALLTGVVAIAAGTSHSIALKLDGTVVGWGGNNESQCDVPTGLRDVVAVAAGGAHSLALKQDGTVVAWGGNSDGESISPVGSSSVVAISVGDAHTMAVMQNGMVIDWGDHILGQRKALVGLSGVVAVASGIWHNVALKQDSTLFAWGGNTLGQCTVPAGLSGIVAVAAGAYHTVGLKQDGSVVAWGENGDGQCTVPAGLSGVVAIAAGSNHTVALKLD
jgi:hypothetical protein